MSDWLKIAIPSSIALVGTVITILFGYRQWKRQQLVSRHEQYNSEKRVVYKDLWSKLENIHIILRTGDMTQQEFLKLTDEIRGYVIEHGLYLDDEDSNLSVEYINSLYTLKKVLNRPGILFNSRELWRDSGRVSIIDRYHNKELHAAFGQVSSLRETLIQRFRKVIGAELTS
jgi:hypothetical protein